MKASKSPSVLEKIKQEMMAQEEGQSEILELTFDSIQIDKFTPEIAKLFQKYNKLISLEFSDCEIKSLDGFPKIPGVVKLSLENNQLNDDCIQFIVDTFKDLQFLSLTNNSIKSLDAIKKLSELPQLVQVDLQDNPVSLVKEYRSQLFAGCQSLEILDNQDKEGMEVNYSDDEDEEDDDDEDDFDAGDIDADGDFADEDDDDEDDDEGELEPETKKKNKH